MGNNSSQKKPPKETVFLSDQSSHGVYRIPALVYNKGESKLYAFSEKRTSPDDSTALALVMRTGTVTEDHDQLVQQWAEIKEVVTKTDLQGYRPMNPCPIYCDTSKTLYLFFIGVEGDVPESWQIWHGINKARLYCMTTQDGGKSWNKAQDLPLPEMKSWSTFAVGPGHGLQTVSGRTIIPAYAYPSCRCSWWYVFSSCCFTSWFGIKCCCPSPHAFSIYSDDQGRSFTVGEMLRENSLECEMAEFSSTGGERLIYCNARSQGCFRVEGVSVKGESFTEVCSKLPETGFTVGCQGSVVSFPAQPEKPGSGQAPLWMLYSHPTSRSKRVDLGVYLRKSSQDSGVWSQPWVINPGCSGYSDLAYLKDGWFACLMECGEKSETEQIACSLFSYNEVQKNTE